MLISASTRLSCRRLTISFRHLRIISSAPSSKQMNRLTWACSVASLPCVLLAWCLLVLGLFQSGLSSPQLGPGRVGLALLLLVPAVTFWSRADHIAVSWGQSLRSLSVLGTMAALSIARFDVVSPGLPAVVKVLLIHVSAACLAPALYEWMVARPWRSVPLIRTGSRSASARPLQLYDGIVVAGLPLLFLFTAPMQLFFPPGWVDAGIYLSLAFDFFDMIRSYGWNYYSLRVSYVLPASFVHFLLPPIPARLFIVAGFYLGGLFSLYTGVRLLWGRVAATVAVATLAYNPVYVMAVTAGYVDGAYITYILAFFAVMAAWSMSGNVAWVVAGGAFAGLAVLAHAMTVAPILFIAIFFALFAWDRLLADAFRVIGAGLVGLLSVWLVFVYVLSSVGFGISAFQTLSWIVSASLNGIGSKYRYPIEIWLPVTTRWTPPLVAAAATLLVLKPWVIGKMTLRTWAVVVLAVATASFLPVYDVLMGGSASQSAFYAGLLLPGVAVVCGAISAAVYSEPPRSELRMVAFVTGLTFGATWSGPWLWSLADALALPITLQGFCGAGLLLAALLGATAGRNLRLSIVALVAFIALLNFASVFNSDTRHVFRQRGTIDNIEYFRAAMFVRRLIQPSELEGRVPQFWFNRPGFSTRDGRLGVSSRPLRYGDQLLELTYFDSLASLRLWDRALFHVELGPYTVIEQSKFLEVVGASFVVLGTSPAAAAYARALLNRAAVVCKIRRTEEFESKSFSIHVTIIDILGVRADGVRADCAE